MDISFTKLICMFSSATKRLSLSHCWEASVFDLLCFTMLLCRSGKKRSHVPLRGTQQEKSKKNPKNYHHD